MVSDRRIKCSTEAIDWQSTVNLAPQIATLIIEIGRQKCGPLFTRVIPIQGPKQLLLLERLTQANPLSR